MTLPIKRKWWDMIRSGEKKEEYRDITPYYAKRFATALGMYHRQLNPKRMEETDARVPIHNIVLRAGYSLDSPTMMVGGMLRVGQGRPEWGAALVEACHTDDGIDHGRHRVEECFWAIIEKYEDGYIYCPITWSGGTCEECMEIFERRMERDDCD